MVLMQKGIINRFSHRAGHQRQSLPNASTKLPTHCLTRDTPLLCRQNRVSTLKTVSTMEVLIIQKEAFEEMAAKFSRFTERMDAILAKQGGRSMNRWIDNQEVCRQRHVGLFANQPQGVLQAGGCDADCQTRRTQPGGQSRLILIVPLNPM